MIPCLPSHQSKRRGVTLIEMLVSVALLVLMMTIIVQIFSAATGAMSGLQAYQELDANLRKLDATIRQDLDGRTAPTIPPLDPKDNAGYFEYGENQFADLQGEDTDDYLKFTTKAPNGLLFTGRVYVPLSNAGSPWTAAQVMQNQLTQPILVTSQYAEVIYFLRNGNLYRRVLLVAPERQSSLGIPSATFSPGMFSGLSVSWQGVNDLSAHPDPVGPASLTAATPSNPIILNTLGDLTNRENRFAAPRFASDFVINTTGDLRPDGLPDNQNGDNLDDFYPSLYYNAPFASPRLVFEANPATRMGGSFATMAFPYIFPGAYSQPDTFSGSTTGPGWIHGLDPSPSPAYSSSLNQLLRINHAPLDSGDSYIGPPVNGVLTPPGGTQTWWGFPTWRETLSPSWKDPTVTVQSISGQPYGLTPFDASAPPPTTALPLPPMTAAWRTSPQPYNDGLGNTTYTPTSLWLNSWEDDLIMTNVRSFDVKAYDNSYPGYVDLGWGDDLRLYQAFPSPPTTPPYQGSPNPGTSPSRPVLPLTITWPPVAGSPTFNLYYGSFAHEGRIPPLQSDHRLDYLLWPKDPQTGIGEYNPFYATSTPTPWSGPPYNYTGNIGDDNASVVRLRRVWDTWSTKYTAPKFGPPISPPIYPSYPPPYPMPLRGIQIQIRVVDPRNEHVKVLTIRHGLNNKQ